MRRDAAWQIVTEYVKSESLRNHMLAVEACMRSYARFYNQDEDSWGVVGLLHDFDYEIHPTLDLHPLEGSQILRERGVPEDVIYTILSHGDHLQHLHPRQSLRDRALVAVDELSGLCTAVALVRPSRSIFDVDTRAVRKKWKDRAFARAINREDIERYTAELGVPLDEHINRVIEALRTEADALGIRGQTVDAG